MKEFIQKSTATVVFVLASTIVASASMHVLDKCDLRQTQLQVAKLACGQEEMLCHIKALRANDRADHFCSIGSSQCKKRADERFGPRIKKVCRH